MKFMPGLLQIIFLVSVFSSCKAQKDPAMSRAPDGNTLLWEVSGNGLASPSYIYGTFHLMCKDQVHISENLITALSRSKEVYFELDLDDLSSTLGALFLMNMKNDTRWKDLYNEADLKTVTAYFRDTLKMPLAMVEKMKPSFAESMLYPKFLNCKNITGVEQEILALAKKENKEIKGLETVAFQMSVFDSIPYKEQAQSLLKTIDSLQQSKIFFDSLVHIYNSQNLSAMEAAFSKPEYSMADNMDILLNKRNINWVSQFKKIFAGQPVLVAVGAGHLVGDQGILALLKKENYTVIPLLNK